MAEHQADHAETPLRDDTFAGFMRFLKLGTGITVVVTAAVIWLIAT
ncbi:hypothetical protein [Sphingomonas baiyangensis]|nr:hypothetical protein [Sphingomonas baiyangensis]